MNSQTFFLTALLKTLLTAILVFAPQIADAQNVPDDQGETASRSNSRNPNYDAALAAKLGGDEYGMKSYYFVILRTGSNSTIDEEVLKTSFMGHMNNINRLVEEGKLIVAGPFGKNDKAYRGLFILNNISSAEEAEALLQTDPAIQNQLLDYELFTWYGSAALPEYLPFSDRIWKIKP